MKLCTFDNVLAYVKQRPANGDAITERQRLMM